MHAGNTLGSVGEDVENLWLGEAVLESRVHKVDEAASTTVLHEQEDLISAAFELRGVGVDVGNDFGVASELLHGLDLVPHVCQSLLVGDSDAFEDSGIGGNIVVGGEGRGEADDVDVGKAAFGQVLFDDNAMGANLDLCAGRESPWRLTCGGHGVDLGEW